MKEILKQLFGEAVTEEVLKKFNTELGVRFVAKADYNTKLEEIKTLKGEKTTLEGKITELSEATGSAEEYKKQLEDLKKEIADKEKADKEAKADAELTDAITAVFGDKKFTSDYVKNGIIADMKSEIAKPENKGKGYAEIFESLTKDKEGIFQNPNQPIEIPGMGPVDPKTSENTMRAIMGLAPNKE